MKWITRERPKIDRIACPWLITRFIDKDPEFLFVPTEHAKVKAALTGAAAILGSAIIDLESK
nr:chromate resistance protein ChrB domain-containing protein [Massilia cavernae]